MAQKKSEEFARLMVAVSRSVSRLEREQVCCGQLTFQQFDTLRRIEQAECASVSAIAEKLGIDGSTASRNVSVLVRDGYLKKARDVEDGRASRLLLTAKGRAALSDLRCDERDVFSALFDSLTAAERVAVMAGLAALEAAFDRGSTACCSAAPESNATSRSR